jgi:transposase
MVTEDGIPPAKVASSVGASRRSVDRWVQAFREGGEDGLAGTPHPGAPCRLSDKQREDLRRRLLAGAQSQGFATELWTCPRVRELIAERYGVEYHVDHIPRLLWSLGFSPQKPRVRSSQRDEAAIDQWVARDWPRIKKRRLDSEPTLFLPTKSASS